jgi:hypothetical protein
MNIFVKFFKGEFGLLKTTLISFITFIPVTIILIPLANVSNALSIVIGLFFYVYILVPTSITARNTFENKNKNIFVRFIGFMILLFTLLLVVAIIKATLKYI